MPNPLAIWLMLGGLLLDVVFPRPKPRAGVLLEPSLLSAHSAPRTPRRETVIDEYESQPVASGHRS